MLQASSVLFQPPAHLIAGLASGELRRTGAVIVHNVSGRIVGHMREGSGVPLSPKALGLGMPPHLQQIMGLAGASASMLNLGATVAFGAATLHKLNKIDQKIDRIAEKLDVMEAKIDELSAKVQKIAWAVDLGFASTLRALGVLERHAESEIIGQLNAAAQSAWSSQFLEPGSTQRLMRLEHAQSMAGEATERLAHITFSELEGARDSLVAARKKKATLSVSDDVVKAMMRLRQLSVACGVRANIMAEAGDLYSASALTKGHSGRLRDLLVEVGATYLNAGKFDVYPLLLAPELSDAMPASRIDYWVDRYDSSVGGALGLMDALRKNAKTTNETDDEERDPTRDLAKMTGAFFSLAAAATATGSQAKKPSARKTKAKSEDTAVTDFFDLLDACWEDVDRLNGYALEMDYASKNVASWQDYRQSLLIEDIPESSNVVFFNVQENELVSA